MGLIRFLIFAICILYVVKTLAKIFLPFLFKKAVNKMYNKANAQNQTQVKPEGTISVDFVPPVSKKQPKLKPDGDFTSFEEVK